MGNFRLVSVACNHCGAALDVAERSQFVTCNYCGSRLAIHRTETASYTEVLHDIRDSSERVEANLEVIRLQNELERLYREWLLNRVRWMITGKDGQKSEPSSSQSIFTGVVSMVFGIAWISFTGRDSFGSHGNGWFPSLGLIPIIAGPLVAFSGINSAHHYEQAKRQYNMSRQAILQQINPQDAPEKSPDNSNAVNPFENLKDWRM